MCVWLHLNHLNGRHNTPTASPLWNLQRWSLSWKHQSAAHPHPSLPEYLIAVQYIYMHSCIVVPVYGHCTGVDCDIDNVR